MTSVLDIAPGYYALTDPYDAGLVLLIRIGSDHRVKVTPYGTNTPGVPRRRGLDWLQVVVDAILGDVAGTRGLFVEISGKCYICGRRLTDPASKMRGVGPDCWARVGGAS